MARTATAKKPPVEAAPVDDDSRSALAAAIQRRKQADDGVAKQEQAIERAAEISYLADAEIEKLRAKIDAADEGDVKRAASLIKAERPVVSGWMGESARRSVSHAEESLAMTDKALVQLRADLAVLQDDAAECASNVLTQIKIVTAPLAQRLVAQLREHKRAAMVTSNMLAVLLDDAARRDAPRFQDSLRRMKAEEQREAPIRSLKAEVERLRFGAAYDLDPVAAAHAVDAIKSALLALQTDASAALPELKV